MAERNERVKENSILFPKKAGSSLITSAPLLVPQSRGVFSSKENPFICFPRLKDRHFFSRMKGRLEMDDEDTQKCLEGYQVYASKPHFTALVTNQHNCYFPSYLPGEKKEPYLKRECRNLCLLFLTEEINHVCMFIKQVAKLHNGLSKFKVQL